MKFFDNIRISRFEPLSLTAYLLVRGDLLANNEALAEFDNELLTCLYHFSHMVDEV